ncbi:MAG: DUF4139 domain-containing protein [Polyangiaceae bacterium]
MRRPSRWLAAIALASALSLPLLTGCSPHRGPAFPTTESGLKLDRVVLYRNGVGYFERTGEVDGDVLRIRVRKDQVNDLLKSLTVVDKSDGKAVSVSMPLDPQSWANAALATLTPGRGNLADVLDALRGTGVTLSTTEGSASGRIVMVETVYGEPGSEPPQPYGPRMPVMPATDHRVTLLDGDEMRVVMLSKVRGVSLEDGDLAMQFNRTLDASAGEGMFQQVEVAIRLTGDHSHDLAVSYVVSAPMWKPTYRVVLPKDGKGKALLQGWAVVDNTSGEDWNTISLGLTSGAPIAFRYDLHTPRDVDRQDLTESGVERHAVAMVGETTYGGEPDPATTPTAAAPPPSMDSGDYGGYGEAKMAEARPATNHPAGASPRAPSPVAQPGVRGRPQAEQRIDYDALRKSTLAQAKADSASGQTRYEIDNKVTVPQGTSTMVAVINADVEGEETFLFRPGGGGPGFEVNPYRVVRFKNATPFVLEAGPISIYSGGSFVGEGISEAVGAGISATIPFAVENDIMVSSASKSEADEMRLVKMSRGVLEVESFGRKTTTWTVKSKTKSDGFNVLIRHPKAGWNYELSDRPEGTEDLADAYLVKVAVPAGSKEGSITVTEKTPSRREISIWESPALPVLEKIMLATDLTQELRAKLTPIIQLRREIGKIDEQIDGLRRQRDLNDQRANETRENLNASKTLKGAEKLQTDLLKKLEEFNAEGNRLGIQMADLEKQKLEKRIALEDLLQDLQFEAPASTKPKGDKPADGPN